MPENPTNTDVKLPALPANEAKLPARVPLVPEASDFLEGDSPAAEKVEAFLARALEATGSEAPTTAGALVPWICDALLSNHSVKAYGRDLMDFLRHMQAQGVSPLEVTADHVKVYVRFEASFRPVMRYAKEVSDITRCSAIGLLPQRASPATVRSEAWGTT